MVYRLGTVKAKVEFDHRTYDLGKTIDSTVTIGPTKNVTIRERRLELIWDQNYTSWTGLPHVVSSGGGRMGTYSSVSVGGGADTRNESYMQGSAILLRDARLQPGVVRYEVPFYIEGRMPPRWADGQALFADTNAGWSFTWRLMLHLDVRMGKNTTVGRRLQIRLTPKQVRRR